MFPRPRSSGIRVSHPPPPPPPPPPPQAQPSSSNLSPLAPPFNVDRSYHSPQTHLPQRPSPAAHHSFAPAEIPPPPPHAGLFHDWFSLRTNPPRDGGAIAPETIFPQAAKPYGSAPSVAAAVPSLDVIRRLAGFEGSGVGRWGEPSSEDVERWTEFLEQGPSSLRSFSSIDASSFQKDQLPKFPGYVGMPQNEYSDLKYSPYKDINYSNPKMAGKNLSRVNQNDGCQDYYTMRTSAIESIQESSSLQADRSQIQTRSTFDSEPSIACSMDGAGKMKCLTETLQPEVNNSAHSGFPLPGNSAQIGSETHELNTAVDSPCWKGQHASYQYFFNAHQPSDINSDAKQHHSSDEFDQNGMNLQPVVQRNTSPFMEENVCINNRKVSSIETPSDSTPIDFQNKNEKLEAFISGTMDSIKGFYEELQPRDIIQEQSRQGIKYEFGECARGNNHNGDDSQERCTVAVSQSELCFNAAARDVADFTASSSSHVTTVPSKDAITAKNAGQRGTSNASDTGHCPRENDRSFIKALHNLSEALLSSFSFDNSVLNGNECQLLRATIQNIETYILNNEGDGRKLSHALGSGLLDCDAKISQSNTLDSDNMKKPMPTTLTAKWSSELVSKNDIAGFQHLRCSSNSLDVAIGSSRSDPENELRSELYKKLWIDAETALCSMKYELQLARMTLEAQKQKLQKEFYRGSPDVLSMPDQVIRPLAGDCTAVGGFAAANDFGGVGSHPKPHCTAPVRSRASAVVTDNVDLTVMDRFRILMERSNGSGGVVEEDKAAEEVIEASTHCKGVEEASSKRPCCGGEGSYNDLGPVGPCIPYRGTKWV